MHRLTMRYRLYRRRNHLRRHFPLPCHCSPSLRAVWASSGDDAENLVGVLLQR
jgi:hypothetical protein